VRDVTTELRVAFLTVSAVVNACDPDCTVVPSVNSTAYHVTLTSCPVLLRSKVRTDDEVTRPRTSFWPMSVGVPSSDVYVYVSHVFAVLTLGASPSVTLAFAAGSKTSPVCTLAPAVNSITCHSMVELAAKIDVVSSRLVVVMSSARTKSLPL
jgi:hypothetical protein